MIRNQKYRQILVMKPCNIWLCIEYRYVRINENDR